MNSILLTGFEPFGGSDVNPSGRAALALDGMRISGARVHGRVLPVSWARAVPALVEAFSDIGPGAVVMSGQSGRPHISPEHVGVNLRTGRDNDGVEVQDEPVVPGGPAAYFSTFDARALARALLSGGIPARVSYTAGTYLCNCALYGMLHHLSREGLSIPAGFVHVPHLPSQAAAAPGHKPPPSMSQETLVAGLTLILEQVAQNSSFT